MWKLKRQAESHMWLRPEEYTFRTELLLTLSSSMQTEQSRAEQRGCQLQCHLLVTLAQHSHISTTPASFGGTQVGTRIRIESRRIITNTDYIQNTSEVDRVFSGQYYSTQRNREQLLPWRRIQIQNVGSCNTYVQIPPLLTVYSALYSGFAIM